MPFTITVAMPGNASLLAQMGAETFTDTFGAANTAEDMDTYVSISFSLQKMQDELSDSLSTFFIIYEDQVPVGYCKIATRAQPPKLAGSKSLEISRLYVVKAWHHKKAGAALMQHCIQLAKAQGYKNVWLQVWQQNAPAIAFYKKWGFKIFDTKVFVLGSDRQDDFLMMLEI